MKKTKKIVVSLGASALLALIFPTMTVLAASNPTSSSGTSNSGQSFVQAQSGVSQAFKDRVSPYIHLDTHSMKYVLSGQAVKKLSKSDFKLARQVINKTNQTISKLKSEGASLSIDGNTLKETSSSSPSSNTSQTLSPNAIPTGSGSGYTSNWAYWLHWWGVEVWISHSLLQAIGSFYSSASGWPEAIDYALTYLGIEFPPAEVLAAIDIVIQDAFYLVNSYDNGYGVYMSINVDGHFTLSSA